MNRQLAIHFAPRQGGRCGGGVNLEIFDIASGTKMLYIELTHEEAGRFCAARRVGVIANVSNHLDRIGTRHETMLVPLPVLKDMTGLFNGPEGRDILARAAAPFEVDGWKVNTGHYFSSKKSTTDGVPLVPFYRYTEEMT